MCMWHVGGVTPQCDTPFSAVILPAHPCKIFTSNTQMRYFISNTQTESVVWGVSRCSFVSLTTYQERYTCNILGRISNNICVAGGDVTLQGQCYPVCRFHSQLSETRGSTPILTYSHQKIHAHDMHVHISVPPRGGTGGVTLQCRWCET
jgi:hypothetical protein